MRGSRKAITTTKKCGGGSIDVILDYDDYKPVKVHLILGKAGGCAGSQLNAIQNLINLRIKDGGDLSPLYDKKYDLSLLGIRCPELMADDEEKDLPPEPEERYHLSCADTIAKSLRYLLGKLNEIKEETEKEKKKK